MLWTALLLAAGTGCAVRAPLLSGQPVRDAQPASVELEQVPHFDYRGGRCGPAALASILAASGVEVSPEALSGEVYLPDRNGSIQPEIMAACRRHGRLPYKIAPEPAAIMDELRHGRPVLVLTNLGLSVFPVWHYAVVIGFDLEQDVFLLRSADNPREVVSAHVFLRTWKRAACWGIIALRPDEPPARPDPESYLQAAADMEEIGKLRQARTSYQTALALWPDEPLAIFGLGNTAYAMGDLKTAERAFRQLVHFEPDNMAAANNLAVVLGELGKIGEALRLIDNALTRVFPGDALRQELIRTRRTLVEQMPSEIPTPE